MEIIVLKNTSYKEKDAIIEGLSEDGSHSFLVKGLLSPKSSNIILSNILVYADIEIQEGKYKHPIIKKSQVIHTPYHLEKEKSNLEVISLLDELTLSLLQEEERGAMFNLLKDAIICLEKERVDAKSIALIYFMQVIKEAGYSFEVNRCTRCGSKKSIAAFSFDEGGFICKDCLTEEVDLSLSKESMLAIRKATLLDHYEDVFELDDNSFKEILSKLKTFVLDYLGVKLISIGFFL